MKHEKELLIQNENHRKKITRFWLRLLVSRRKNGVELRWGHMASYITAIDETDDNKREKNIDS